MDPEPVCVHVQCRTDLTFVGVPGELATAKEEIDKEIWEGIIKYGMVLRMMLIEEFGRS